MAEDPKMVIVVRKDLRMNRGKELAQCSHAAMLWLQERVACDGFSASERDANYFEQGRLAGFTGAEVAWLSEGRYAKVVVQVDSEAALEAVHDRALAAGLESHLVVDSGATYFGGVPTKTCCAVGPDWPDRVDGVTGHLKLY